ncbi:hypothetical protein AB0J74_12765 [Asanoa sp. NPDC049573]|uniref:hypothetical protein n=1 Tax=Asanoa sp. NPDC049573 TaxID=3155396 RepID=UPI0034396BA6
MRLAESDPLAHERTLLFVGSHYGSGFFARRRTDDPGEQTWLCGTCYDYDRIVEATLTLIHRIPMPPADGPPR